MASGGSRKEHCHEATCSICLEYFTDPLTTECGHNFCRACLTRSCGASGGNASCPLCREPVQRKNFRQNQQLANLVELVKKLQGEEKPKEKKALCERHQEPLKLFCRDHEAPICMVCNLSKEHNEHRIIPMDEAAQEYKEKIKNQQKSLEEKSLWLWSETYTEQQKGRRCSLELKEARQKCVSAFELMQKILEETKCSWLVLLDDLEKETGKRMKENVTRLQQESSNVSNLIKKMARKCQLPGNEFLQDIRSILRRYEAAQGWQLVDFFPGLEETIAMYTQKNTALEKAVKNIKGKWIVPEEEKSFESDTEWSNIFIYLYRIMESLEEALQKANVTLNQKTAHPRFSWYDPRAVRLGDGKWNPPDNPERFDAKLWVLGCERFASGRHWWEVEVKGESTEWAVGVAKESVRRKGDICLSPDEGIWAMGQVLAGDGYRKELQLTSFTSPKPTILHFGSKCTKIWVSLDYDAGCVAFSCAGEPLFTFPSTSFSGERLYPFFELKSQGGWGSSGHWLKLHD